MSIEICNESKTQTAVKLLHVRKSSLGLSWINGTLSILFCAGLLTVPGFAQLSPSLLSGLREIVSYERLPPNARFRIGTENFRPAGSVCELVLSPNGKVLVTMGEKLEAWDAQTGRKLWSADPHDYLASHAWASYGGQTIVISSDGKRVFSPGDVNEFIAWDLETGVPRMTKFAEGFDHAIPFLDRGDAADYRTPKGIDISSDSKHIALCNSQGVIVGTSDGKVLAKFKNQVIEKIHDMGPVAHDRLTYGGHYASARFSPDDKVLALVLSDSPDKVRLIGTDDFKVFDIIELASWVVRLDFSPDGKHLITTERDSAVRAYDIESTERVWECKIEMHDRFENYLSQIKYSPDDSMIAVCATDKSIYLLDPHTGKINKKLDGHHWYPWAIDFSPDSKTLYSSGWDKVIRRWDFATGIQLELPEGVHATGLAAASLATNDIAVEDDRGNVHLIDASKGTVRGCLKMSASEIKFSPDGKLIAGGGLLKDQLWVSIWNASTLERVHHWEWPRGKDLNTVVDEIAFNESGTRVGAAIFRQGKAYVWNLETDSSASELAHKSVYGISFSPIDDRLVTCGWDSRLRFWNSNDGQSIGEINLEDDFGKNVQIYHVSFSPDGRYVAAGHSLDVSVWDAKELKLRNQFKYDNQGGWATGELNFSPDGLWLCTGEMSQTVKLWEPFTGQKVCDLGHHESRNFDTVEFGAQGTTLLSGADDGVCYLWDLASSAELADKNLEEIWSNINSNNAPMAIQAYWELSRRGDKTVELIKNKLSRVTQVIDDFEVKKSFTKDLETEKAASRVALLDKVIATNPKVVHAVAVNRALSLLVRIDTAAARQLLTDFAFSNELEEKIVNEARRLKDIETAKGRHGQ